jgi:hypothetical protein
MARMALASMPAAASRKAAFSAADMPSVALREEDRAPLESRWSAVGEPLESRWRAVRESRQSAVREPPELRQSAVGEP